MANPLLTGVSGLNSHQRMLEVIGNNLANLNTIGFKAKTALFSDLLYDTIREPSGGTPGVSGGVAPAQVGSGVQLAQVSTNFTQGNLEATGSSLDFAIDGDGFFVVDSGGGNLYTRAGAFSIDEDGILVDPSTGFRVQRIGAVGEPNGSDPAFQVPGDNDIRIPLGASVPGQPTTSARLSGNLPSQAQGPLAEELTVSLAFTVGGSPATASTLLSDLDTNITDYVVGDAIMFNGTDSTGSPFSQTMAVDGTTTLGDLVAAIDADFANSTATLDANGRIIIEANDTGEAFMSLSITDMTTNVGRTTFSEHNFVVTTQGKEADVVRGGIEIFDVRGESNTLNVVLEKQTDGSWNLIAEIDPSVGTLIDNRIEGIRFNDDGSFGQVVGSGDGDPDLTIQFAGSGSPQTIDFTFGDSGSFDGLTELAAEANLAAQQDGFAPGVLNSIQVRADGVIEGVATNGREIEIAQLAIGSFSNPHGLVHRGNSYYESSLSSGEVEVGTALAGNRGAIRAGQIERSNVDIALEFTRLIVAQRGFSANARTITITDQMLEELTNLIR